MKHLAAALALALLAGATTSDGAADPPCPSAVVVLAIAPVRGEGYAWVRALYEDAEGNVAPAWSAELLTATRSDRRAWPIHTDVDDPFVAYFGGPAGTYLVRAVGPCRVSGELVVVYGRDDAPTR